MTLESCLYEGVVVHKRLRPKEHALSYRVFAALFDVDRIDELAARSVLFSRNRWNVISFHDRDHGSGDGAPVAAHARAVLQNAGLADATARIFLLCYPRIAGYGFNPISVYYGYNSNERLSAVIYEVNNTFGERRSYVFSIVGMATGGVHEHACEKELYVSPFTEMAGRYGFRLGEPAEELVLGVSLRDPGGPVLKTHFKGIKRLFSTRTLLRVSLLLPLQSFKVMGAIHFEALRLWLKGVPLTARPFAPRYAVTNIPTPAETNVPPARTKGLS